MVKIRTMAIVMESTIIVRRSNVNSATSSYIGVLVIDGNVFTAIYIDIVTITNPVVISFITAIYISGVFTAINIFCICASVRRPVRAFIGSISICGATFYIGSLSVCC